METQDKNELHKQICLIKQLFVTAVRKEVQMSFVKTCV